MAHRTVFLISFLLSHARFLQAEECTTGFSVVAPELAVPGKTTAVLVTLHGPTSLVPINVTLRLMGDGAEELNQQLVETTQEIHGHGILPLEVPSDATGCYVLQTLVNCSGGGSGGDGGSCTLQSSSQMKLVGPVRDVIIRPARHAYRPGDTVSFWVLALDHDLQIASGVIGSVSVRDPAGTKVALWDQVPLDEGVKPFSLPLSERATLGRWRLQVDVDSMEFSIEIDVSAIGSGFGLPDIAAAEEHYVELRFGREMRRRYKPGLPFIGKVEAMSTERSVRVRVKVYDNTTSIYSQDIEISQGEGTFIVPAILADSDVIALQAELVSVEGKEIESHYVLAREPIHKWNSSSDCYLLIEGVEHTLQPDEDAHVAILSTCPCERDLHYVITTDGRVTDWAQRRYEDPVPPTTVPPASQNGEGVAICRLNFSFTVRSVMAPVSQLLVYYVTAQGESVSDVISFDVKLLQRQVYVNIEEREFWYPNQALDVEIVAEHSSLVCLIGGRSGTGNDVRFDPRVSDDRTPSTETGEVDFLEAGVSFFQRQCVRRGDSDIFAVSYRQRGSGAGPANRRRPQESLVGGEPFDMLWLWKCFNYSSEIAASGLTLSAPDEAGRWSLWALTLASTGLRFSSPVSVNVFRPLQAEFRLPPSLRVGESLEVDVKIGNNINTCMDVTALLALSEGAQFLTNGLLYVTERLRLGPHGATSLVVRILVSAPGLKNMTVEVNGYTSASCDVAGAAYTNESLAGAVVRSATVLVRPEGLVRSDTESAYFCANENMVISTTNNFKYEWLSAPRNRAALVFELRSSTGGPAHVALSDTRYPTERMYHLAIGDSSNSVTWIGRGKHGYSVQLASVATPEVLTQNRWRTFWISWERNSVSFGEGTTPQNRTLLKWRMDKKMKVQYVGFASAWGTTAEFRVWNYNDEAGFSQVLHLDIPRSVVPGSESGSLLVTGGLALPSPHHLRRQSSSLQGAIAALTPLLLLEHLGAKANETFRQATLATLPGKIQSVLSFRNADNSFSEHHLLSSHSATVQILEALTKTQSFFSVDPDLVQEVKRWIQLRQEDDGSFTPLPADVKINNDNIALKAFNITEEVLEFEHTVEITAETVITLYEVGVENQIDSETITNAQSFLEDNLTRVKLSSGIAATALALILVKSIKTQLAIDILKNISTTEEGDFGWPHPLPRRDAADWLYEAETGRTLKEPILTTAEDFKASICALTAFCLINDLKSAEAVARYLFYRSHMLDKHIELIYPSVKAFSKFSSLAYDKHRALTVSLATSGMELTDTLELKTDHTQQILHLPSLPTKVFVYATGAGCATIQGHTSYSTYAAVAQTPLLDLWSKVMQEIVADRSSVEEIEGKLPMLKIKTCFRWKNAIASGVLRLEISLFSGYELFSVNSMPVDPEGGVFDLQHGSHANDLWFVFANVTSRCPICVQYIIRSAYVISSLRPAFARVFPAAREDLAAETFFHSQTGSELLTGITDDDLITWFGKNLTLSANVLDHLPEECRDPQDYATSTTDSLSLTSFTTLKDPNEYVPNITTTDTDDLIFDSSSTATPESIPLADELSVTTYTINVDSNSIFNHLTRPLTKSNTTHFIKHNTSSSITENNMAKNDTMDTLSDKTTENHLEPALSNVKINQTNFVALINTNRIVLNKKYEDSATKANGPKLNNRLKSIKLRPGSKYAEKILTDNLIHVNPTGSTSLDDRNFRTQAKKSGMTQAKNPGMEPGVRYTSEEEDKSKPLPVEPAKSDKNHQRSSTYNENLLTNNKKPPVNNDKPLTTNERPSVNTEKLLTNIETPTINDKPQINNRRSLAKNERSSMNNRSLVDSEKSSVDNNRTSIDNNRPAMDNKKSLTYTERPVMNYERPSNNSEKPPVDNDRSLTNIEMPSLDNERSLMNNEKPSTDTERPLTSNKKPSVENSRSSMNSKRSPTNNKRSLTNHERSSPNNENPVMNVERPSTVFLKRKLNNFEGDQTFATAAKKSALFHEVEHGEGTKLTNDGPRNLQSATQAKNLSRTEAENTTESENRTNEIQSEGNTSGSKVYPFSVEITNALIAPIGSPIHFPNGHLDNVKADGITTSKLDNVTVTNAALTATVAPTKVSASVHEIKHINTEIHKLSPRYNNSPETDNDILSLRKDNNTEVLPTKKSAALHEARHINTEIHQLPAVYTNFKKDEDDEKSSTFLPENRDNNKFLVVDKNALWGMLKEAVHDELDKKDRSKEEDGRKLRNQGFT